MGCEPHADIVIAVDWLWDHTERGLAGAQPEIGGGTCVSLRSPTGHDHLPHDALRAHSSVTRTDPGRRSRVFLLRDRENRTVRALQCPSPRRSSATPAMVDPTTQRRARARV